MKQSITLPDIQNIDSKSRILDGLSSIIKELDPVCLSLEDRVDVTIIEELLPNYYVLIGAGFEGAVYKNIMFPDLVVKVFYECKEEDIVLLYPTLPESINLPKTLHATKRYKIMEHICSNSLTELQDAVSYSNVIRVTLSNPHSLGLSVEETIIDNPYLITDTGIKFDHNNYGKKMKEFISFIVFLSEKGIFINDLSMSNIHYETSSKRFVILDYDLMSTTALEFPRFLEECYMSKYKDYFLELLMKSSVDKNKCIDLFERVTTPMDVESPNWYHLFTRDNRPRENSQHKQSFFEHYYARNNINKGF